MGVGSKRGSNNGGGWRVERDPQKVFGVATLNDVYSKLATSNLTGKQLRAVLEYYVLANETKATAQNMGITQDSVRRLRKDGMTKIGSRPILYVGENSPPQEQ